jgi:hypothetical protein
VLSLDTSTLAAAATTPQQTRLVSDSCQIVLTNHGLRRPSRANEDAQPRLGDLYRLTTITA